MKYQRVGNYKGTNIYWACRRWGYGGSHDFIYVKLDEAPKLYNPQTGERI